MPCRASPRGGDRWSRLDRAVRYQRRCTSGGNRRGSRSSCARGQRFPSEFIPIMTATWPWPMLWRPFGRVRPRCRVPSTDSGERCGNVDLCSVVGNLALKYPAAIRVLSDGKLEHLTELSRYVYETANMNFRSSQPFVGSQCVCPQGRDARSRNPARMRRVTSTLSPASVGNERRVLISELSGKSNIAEKLGRARARARRRIAGTRARPGPGPGERGLPVRGCRGVVRAPGRAAGRPSRSWFDVQGYHVSVNGKPGHESSTSTEATIKLTVDGLLEHTVSEGDGPVNALDGALRKALEGHYSRLKEMSLVDYKVPRDQCPGGYGRAGASRDREQGQRSRLGDRRRLGECDRSELAGARRLV